MATVSRMPEWIWAAGGPLIALLVLVFLGPHNNHTPPAVMFCAVAAYVAITRRFALAAWFGSVAMADMMFWLSAAGAVVFTGLAFLKLMSIAV
jgi:hypothetical protein